MICQSCKQNHATVHLTEIVQKAKHETHLCEECARSKGISYNAQFSVKDFLGGLGKGQKPAGEPKSPPHVGGEPTSGAAAAAAAASAAQVNPSLDTKEPCPRCRLTYGEFRQSGRLGCAHDYEHFKRPLMPLLEKIHAGNRQHTGRVPSKVSERLARQERITQVQQELQEAVSSEDYERAAKLRDLIQELQVGERP